MSEIEMTVPPGTASTEVVNALNQLAADLAAPDVAGFDDDGGERAERVRSFVQKLLRFRETLPPREQTLLDAILLQASGVV